MLKRLNSIQKKIIISLYKAFPGLILTVIIVPFIPFFEKEIDKIPNEFLSTFMRFFQKYSKEEPHIIIEKLCNI